MFEDIAKIVSFASDLISSILGLIGLYVLIFCRGKISVYVRLFLNSHLNDRIKRVKETLGKIESFDYKEKADRPEIFDLLGQLAGQVQPLVSSSNGLQRIYLEIMEIQEKKKPLNEANKRRIIYELHGALDNEAFSNINSLIKNSDERKT